MVGIYNNYSYGFGNIGRTWAPKQQRLMVGRDIAPIHKEPEKEKMHGIVLADSAASFDNAMNAFSSAERLARRGFDPNGPLEQLILPAKDGQSVMAEAQLLGSSDNSSVCLAYVGGQAKIVINSPDGKGGVASEIIDLKKGTDLRISWDKSGGAQVLEGDLATSGGKLAAQGEDEILIRMSDADVVAGKGSTVLNLGGRSGGSFGGGHNVKYLGTYEDSFIDGGTGTTKFAGYFSNSEIIAAKGAAEFSGVFVGLGKGIIQSGIFDDVFSGFFQAMDIEDKGGKNTYSGTFTTNSKISSGNGGDTFNGRFFDSSIKAGNGDNIFGNRVDLSNGSVSADFVRTIIEAGSGKDSFIGMAEESSIKLGEGDDQVSGIVLSSELDAGDGNDELTLLLANDSQIAAGKGDDELHIITASASTVSLGEGNDKMTSGLNRDVKYGEPGTERSYTNSAFLTALQAKNGLDPKYGQHFGDVAITNIDASQGENEIAVHDGRNVHSVKSGELEKETEPKAEVQPFEPHAGSAELLGAEVRASVDLQNKLYKALTDILDKSYDGAALMPESKEQISKTLETLREAKEARIAAGTSESERFVTSILGGWLPNPGGNSVTIDGGEGRTVSFDRMARHGFEGLKSDGSGPLREMLHKYRNFSGINS